MRQDRKPPLGTLERYFKYRLTETGVRGNSGPINRLSGRQVRNEADHDHACKLHTRVRRLLARSQKMRPIRSTLLPFVRELSAFSHDSTERGWLLLFAIESKTRRDRAIP